MVKFWTKEAKPRTQILAIELGTTTSKAVYLTRGKEKIQTIAHGVCDSPLASEEPSPAIIAAHFRKLAEAVGYPGRDIVVALPMRDVVLQSMLMPDVPGAELRQILKLSGRKYFHQDVGHYTFDTCSFSATAAGPQPPRMRAQKNVVVVGAKREWVQHVQKAAGLARFRLQALTLSQLGAVSAVRLAMPEGLQERSVVVLDFGFGCATISLLLNGNPAVTRVIDIDGERLNRGLADSYRVAASVAAEFKMEMIRSRVREHLAPLAQEFRAAIQFFESEHDCQIAYGVITGDLAESDLLVETLQLLEVPCERLKGRSDGMVSFPAASGNPDAKWLPQFTSSAGAGAGWLAGTIPQINLLAEYDEEREARRRDPVRRAVVVAALLIGTLFVWAGEMRWRNARVAAELAQCESQRKTCAEASRFASLLMRSTTEAESVVRALQQHATNRFLCAPVLDGLQHATSEDVQLVRMALQEAIVTLEATKAATNSGVVTRRKPGASTGTATLTLMAKNAGETVARERFIEHLQSTDYFKAALRPENPVTLKSQLPRQVDLLDPSQTFSLFTIECAFPEKVIGHD